LLPGKPDAVKVARPVWSGGKTVRSYLSLPTSYFNPIGDRLYRFFLEHGVLLRPLGNVVYVMPPYCISDEQLDQVYTVIRAALDTIPEPDRSA
jgi:adenosylmethionine-8-amino-7-oxononanoate aminotransferase